jgi:hypothetical protein
VAVALLAPVAQAKPGLSGGEKAPGAKKASQARTQAGRRLGGTDWTAIAAGATGSAVVVAIGAGVVELLRRRELTT